MKFSGVSRSSAAVCMALVCTGAGAQAAGFECLIEQRRWLKFGHRSKA